VQTAVSQASRVKRGDMSPESIRAGKLRLGHGP